VAVWTVFVGFVNVCDIEDWPVWALPPVIPPVTTGAPQLKVVLPGTIVVAAGEPFTGETVKALPLQIVLV
jgi:hypothetical protein